MPPSCAVLGGFAIGARVALLWQHNANPSYYKLASTTLRYDDIVRTRNVSKCSVLAVCLVTFCVSRRRRKMYCGHARLCVCLSVCLSVYLSAAVRPHYCMDPDVTWGRVRGCLLVVHYWADLQSGHGLRCYGNITRTLVPSLRPSRDMTT